MEYFQTIRKRDFAQILENFCDCRECRRAVLHDITVLSKNRVYFTASILKVQWLAHTLHKILTSVNL